MIDGIKTEGKAIIKSAGKRLYNKDNKRFGRIFLTFSAEIYSRKDTFFGCSENKSLYQNRRSEASSILV